jgi:hypothetical protein
LPGPTSDVTRPRVRWLLRLLFVSMAVNCGGTLTYQYFVIAPASVPLVAPAQSPTVELRAEPDSAKVVARVPSGIAVKPAEKRGDWTRVASDESPSVSGWVLDKYVERKAVVATPAPAQGPQWPLPPVSWDAVVGALLASALGGFVVLLSLVRGHQRVP